jgi:Transposase IS116/IS110/IS902 family
MDERIEALSDEIMMLGRQDKGCERLMTVPGIGPIISSAIVAAIGTGDAFAKGRDFGAWLGLVPKQMSPVIAPSSAAYRGVAIVICVRCLFRPPGSCWSRSSRRDGSATGSRRGSKLRSNACTATFWRSRSPTSSPGSPGRFFTRGALSSASRPMRPALLDSRAVLRAVKAWPGNTGASGEVIATASLDGPCAARHCIRRPGRRNGRQARTKEQRE